MGYLAERFKNSELDTLVFCREDKTETPPSGKIRVVLRDKDFRAPSPEIAAIEEIKTIRFEHFENLDLSQIFTTLAGMKGLEEICFYHSGIKNIPPEIGVMRQLRRLTFESDVVWNIKSWEMRAVPPEFGDLENLRELSLLDCNCFYKGFPATAADLHNLRSIKFVESQSLRALPENIERLPNLEHLYFSSSKINPSNLEPLLDKMKTLGSITIKQVFYYFEETVGKYPHIKFYDDGLKFSPSLAAFANEPEKLPAIGEFLKAARSKQEEVEYAHLIVKKHFALNDLKFKRRGVPTSMSSVSWDLYLHIDGFVSHGEHPAMLKNLLAELTDFCEAATHENFAYSLFTLFEKFIDRDPPRSKFLPLLPAKALQQYGEMEEIISSQHDAYMESLNQSGY